MAIWPRRHLARALLGLGISLVLAEIGARLVVGFLVRRPDALQALAEREGAVLARRAVEQAGTDPTLDRAWYDASPPPLARHLASPQLVAVERAEPGAREAQAAPAWFRVWNTARLERPLCQQLPERLWVFDPAPEGAAPSHRLLPSTTRPDGLTTNAFGWRGPEVPVDKPPGTIRVAFLGGSALLGSPEWPFSVPELVIHWLNLWARAQGMVVRFDGANAARDGVSVRDTVAILDHEILPMEPDLVVWTDPGPGPLELRRLLPVTPAKTAAVAPDESRPPRAPETGSTAVLLRHSSLALLLTLASHLGGPPIAEPVKPPHEGPLPVDLDGETVALGRPDLPLGLARTLQDLDLMRRMIAARGGTLGIAAFPWLAGEGLLLHPARQSSIWNHLNGSLWPLRYDEVRRVVRFRDQVLARFARTHSLPDLDVGPSFPAEPALFLTGDRLGRAGARLRAWLLADGLIAWLRPRIVSGELPRQDLEPAFRHPGIGPVRRIDNPCR